MTNPRFALYETALGIALKNILSGMLHEVLSVKQLGSRLYITYVWNEGQRTIRMGSPASLRFRVVNQDGVEFRPVRYDELRGFFVLADGTIQCTMVCSSWVAQYDRCMEDEINFNVD